MCVCVCVCVCVSMACYCTMVTAPIQLAQACHNNAMPLPSFYMSDASENVLPPRVASII